MLLVALLRSHLSAGRYRIFDLFLLSQMQSRVQTTSALLIGSRHLGDALCQQSKQLVRRCVRTDTDGVLTARVSFCLEKSVISSQVYSVLSGSTLQWVLGWPFDFPHQGDVQFNTSALTETFPFALSSMWRRSESIRYSFSLCYYTV